MASGDRDGDGFIQVSEPAAYVQDRVPGQQQVMCGRRLKRSFGSCPVSPGPVPGCCSINLSWEGIVT